MAPQASTPARDERRTPVRNDTVTIVGPDGPDGPDGPSVCRVCGQPFVPSGRRRYCSDRGRQAGWRRRQPLDDGPPLPAAATRRSTTVYACGSCDRRFLGEQWCPDCQRPCRRIGPGGLCPHCDEPVALVDLWPMAPTA
jgi:hypothetical protein